MAKRAASTTTRPYWASKKNAQTAPITFNRKLGDATKIHSLAELQQLEELLIKAFRRISLAGDFTLVFVAKEKGSSDSKGLTLFGVTKNSVNVAFQPGSNDTRFSYGIPLPSADMAIDVHKHLDEVLKQPAPESDVKRPALALVPKVPEVDVAPEPVAAKARVQVRVAEVEAAGELIMVEFDASLDGTTPFDDLKNQLLAVLARYGSEGLFTVKKGEASNAYTASSVGLEWCMLQPGAAGIGFWFRESTTASWHKYALLPDAVFDLESFAAEVAPQNSAPVASKVKGILHNDAPRAAIMDYAEDVDLYTKFMTRMAEEMQRGSVQVMPSKEMTRIFTEVVGAEHSPVNIGRIMTRWVEQSWLRRFKRNQSSGNYNYSLGLKASEVLPENLQGLAPKRVAPPTPKAPRLVREPMVKPAAPVAPAPSAVVVKAPVHSVISSNAVADALEELTLQERKIADAKAMLSQFVELSGQVKALDADLTSIEDKIKALLEEEKTLRQQRDALAEQLPSQEVIARLMQSLRS